MTHICTNKCINQHFTENFLKIFNFSQSSLLFAWYNACFISKVLLNKISDNCYKKTEGLQAARKGFHIQKPGSPSGYQSILTNFEACPESTLNNINNKSTLVQVMGSCISSTKTLSKPMLTYSSLVPEDSVQFHVRHSCANYQLHCLALQWVGYNESWYL